MESLPKRKLITLLAGWLLLASVPTLLQASYPEYDEETVIKRLKEIETPLVDLKYNNVVKGYLKGYFSRNRKNAERITGRAVLYFPIIESYLEEYGMPEKLKYLPVVESALNPHAISPAGACGLWQFMPGTARDYGLKINEYVDERRDPHKSTKAALGYLERAYKKYGDWALALAAYNGGSGRVSRAIKRGRSKNFWRIRRYMPRETRHYVSAYIAATYLMEYYKEHEVEPQYPDLEMQITESMEVYNVISFYRISQLTGLSLKVIKQLNPAYKRDLIPADKNGNFLILPKRVMQAIQDYLDAQRPDHLADEFFDDEPVKAASTHPEENYHQTTYHVKSGETLAQIARQLNCSVHQLIAWNKLKGDSLHGGQALKVFYPKEIRRFKPMKPMPTLEHLPAMPAQKQRIEALTPSRSLQMKRLVLFYLVQEKQTLMEFSTRWPGLSITGLMELNELEPADKLRPGDAVRVIAK